MSDRKIIVISSSVFLSGIASASACIRWWSLEAAAISVVLGLFAAILAVTILGEEKERT